jgi:hypothetical protein
MRWRHVVCAAPRRACWGCCFRLEPARQIAIAFAPGARRQIDVVDAAAAQLRMTLTDIETGSTLGDEAFVAVVPPGARVMSLDELRRISPFAAPQGQ